MSDDPTPVRSLPWRTAISAWFLSEAFAIGILWGAGWMRFSLEEILCTLSGPLAFVTAFPRFQYHSLLHNALFVLVFMALAAAAFLHVWRPRRWTLVISLIAWLLWPWLGFLFTIHHV
jgi:hypothetical protein